MSPSRATLVGLLMATVATPVAKAAPSGRTAAPVLAPSPSRPSAVFAIVIGVNAPRERSGMPLRFADDDALAFHRIFGALGRSTLLTTFDSQTSALQPGLRPTRPTRSALLAAIRRARAGLARERARGKHTLLYLVYSGHGGSKNNAGYLTLEDGGRFTSADLAALLANTSAAETHVIIDACDSYYMLREKRAGGRRGRVSGHFHRPRTVLERFPNVGFVLSTSGAAASHEWARYQAGVFSHEVRSALLGAADVDGDGVVSYGELGTFILVANRSIRNHRYRPKVFLRAPGSKHGSPLLRLPLHRRAHLRIVAPVPRRYYIETALGVRLADFHLQAAEPITIWRPTSERLFVHDLSRRLEYPLAATVSRRSTRLAALKPRPASVRAKGALHEAFRCLFSQPFGLGEHRRLVAKLRYDEPAIARAASAAPAAGSSEGSTSPRHTFYGGYLLRRGYLQEASALHGVGLGYVYWWGRLGLGVTASYGHSRYQRSDRIEVRYDDIGLAVRGALSLWRSWRLALDVSAEVTAGWGFQKGTLDWVEVVRVRANQPLFGYGGRLGLELALTDSLRIRLEGLLGQLFRTREDELTSSLRVGGQLGLSWAL